MSLASDLRSGDCLFDNVDVSFDDPSCCRELDGWSLSIECEIMVFFRILIDLVGFDCLVCIACINRRRFAQSLELANLLCKS